MRRIRGIVVAGWALLLLPVGVHAQSVQVSGGVDLVLPQPSTTYDTRYVPPVQYISDFSGEAGQTLDLHRKREPPLWGAVAWFPARHFGVEGRVRYRTGPLEGESSAQRLSLTYTSRQPPDYTPRQFTITRSDAQPDPAGELNELAIELLGVGRFGDPRRVEIRIGGGVAFLALDGEIAGINFAHYQMGGHSTLAGFDHKVTLDVGRQWGLGAAATLDLHHAFNSHVGILLGGHWLVPEVFELPVRVGGVEEHLITPSVEYVQQWLNPQPLRIRPWTADLTVGFRLSF